MDVDLADIVHEMRLQATRRRWLSDRIGWTDDQMAQTVTFLELNAKTPEEQAALHACRDIQRRALGLE